MDVEWGGGDKTTRQNNTTTKHYFYEVWNNKKRLADKNISNMNKRIPFPFLLHIIVGFFLMKREKVFGTTRQNCNREKKILADNNNHLHMNKKNSLCEVPPSLPRSFPNFSSLCLMIVSSLPPTSISPSCKPSSSVAYNLCYLLPLLNDNNTEKNIHQHFSLSLFLSLSNVITFRHLTH